jgi:poly-beta-1,6-N-acetyl-D-glucosamine synthase
MSALSTAAVSQDRRMRPAMQVTALIPAHNEEMSIGDTIRSLARQSLRPAQIVVICDNCTDDTAGAAAAAGAAVLTTVNNGTRKAGALNQALGRLLPALGERDLVLIMDADSRISDQWIESAVRILRDAPWVGGVCGVFLGEPGGGFVGQLQRNEYFRYAREVHRRRQAPVLSGTGTLFRASVLRLVGCERGRSLPGAPGDYYNSHALTEDNEITLALKTLGDRCVAGAGCETTTEVMPTWKALYRQRLRWQVGALSDLRNYGFNRVTLPYLGKQFALYGLFQLSIACWVIMGIALIQHPGFNVGWTIGILSVNFIERLWTVRRAGLAGMILSMLTVPEMIYEVFRMVVFFRAFIDAVTKRDLDWGHLDRSVQS